MVRASELFPLRQPVKDKEELSPVHPVVPGECVLFLGETRGGVISLSNYRLYVTTSPGFINIPLGLIEQVEPRDLFNLHIYCKDGRYYRIQFSSASCCESWTKKILDEISPPVKIEDIFSFAHYAWASETAAALGGSGGETAAALGGSSEATEVISWFRSELARLRFDLQGAWRVSMANQDFKLCPTYPQELLLPACISDSTLEKVGQFRIARRIPVVVWRNTTNGAVLARCSQPEVGWLGWRSAEDEELVRAIADACAYDSGRQRNTSESSSNCDVNSISSSSSLSAATSHGEIPSLRDLSAEVAARQQDVKKVLIVDARSYAAAFGNRARGGGVECPEYYPNAEILFMNLANIHSIRKSFACLRVLCHSASDQSYWFQALDRTQWLHHLSGLLKAALRCVTALQTEGRPVIVHCSDGWDRTPQITSLTELLMDPYYRTMEGFQILVEKEWLDFGHKMADRCGQGLGSSDANERCPIFLQWLDCVHQLLLQFPVSFQFNLAFLVKMAQHTYTNLFGTFLANSLSERKKLRIRERTRSIWGYLRSHPSKFRNFLFIRRDEVLRPKCEVRDLLLWKDVYVGEGESVYGSLMPSSTSSSSQESTPPEVKEKSRDSSTEDQHQDTKCQNGTKESSPEVGDTGTSSCSQKEEEEERQQQQQQFTGPPPPPPPPRVVRRSLIETSTDTLVGELEGRLLALPLASSSSSALTISSSSSSSSAPVQYLEPLDSDGLVSQNDEVQRRMVEIFSIHQAEMTALKRDLYMSRIALTQAGVVPTTPLSLPGDEGGMDHGSGVESATSEVSWEAVDERETRPTLWVPDHAATACMGCQTQFWFGRRKHHCRSCGRLFCSECSERTAPLPAEQLYQPVRVCNSCYAELSVNFPVEQQDDNAVHAQERADRNGVVAAAAVVAVAEKNGFKSPASAAGPKPANGCSIDDSRLKQPVKTPDMPAVKKQLKTAAAGAATATGEEDDNDEEEEEEDVVTEICDNLRGETGKSAE